jgi:hypothetical protein
VAVRACSPSSTTFSHSTVISIYLLHINCWNPTEFGAGPSGIERKNVLSLAPKRYPYVVTLNASEHTEWGVTLVSTTDDFIRGLSGTTNERFRPAFRRDP